MSTHTPGPWRVSNRAGSGYGKEFMVYTPKGAAFIGDQLAPDGVSIAEARANAELATKAPIAPKLAEALRDCIGSLQSCASWIPRDSGGAIAREVVQAEVKRYSATLAEWDAQS